MLIPLRHPPPIRRLLAVFAPALALALLAEYKRLYTGGQADAAVGASAEMTG